MLSSRGNGNDVTLAEFEFLRPELAQRLRAYVGYPQHNDITGVFMEDGRWIAHCWNSSGFEICYEARCHPSCLSGSGYRRYWVWEDHRCCEACKVDSAHHYTCVHE